MSAIALPEAFTFPSQRRVSVDAVEEKVPLAGHGVASIYKSKFKI